MRRSANNWWLRSPNVTNTTNFWYINNNGNANNNNASNTNGVSFGFCADFGLNKVTLKVKFMPVQKGCATLPAKRINKYLDLVNRTLLALSPDCGKAI